MTLSGEAREELLNIDIDVLTVKTSVKNLLTELDRGYLKDESSHAYKAYGTFEKLTRLSDMSTSNYVIKFQQSYFKAKVFPNGDFVDL